ncbi:MAG: OmpH family outer membrane protein [Chitinophagaceae bacterium]
MKQISTIVQVILAVAVAVLFYLHFSNKPNTTVVTRNADGITSLANNKIAYFELDSLENQYTYFKETRNYLRRKDDEFSRRLNSIKLQYENKLKEANAKGPSMTQAEQTAFQQELMRIQENYRQTEQEGTQEMQALSLQKMQEVKKTIQDFLKTYCEGKGYAYVFASSENDYLYYKDSAQNITNDLIAALNKQYKEKQNK